eukprot:jgi/Galph1/5073/GphlegSOOS_G3764.1
MGVPAFFRWLSLKYPKILSDVIELVGPYDEQQKEYSTVDPTQPNPNGREFDNLYLDMNGIIHPCSHPEDRPPPTTASEKVKEEEMFEEIFHYIDRLVYMIRPRKLLYLAVDGVAPRAKINQQRSRRFRAAKEAEEKEKEILQMQEEWKKQGLKLPEGQISRNPFDSNVITPGTPFMTKLSNALRSFIADRVAHDAAYRNITILYSDASVPGEGEHKIAEFIRTQRAQTGYNPNTSHVLYGLDADLIMLALATHELNFYVLRERIFPIMQSKNRNNNHLDAIANAVPNEEEKDNVLQNAAAIGARKPFQLLSIDVLRECLEAEFGEPLEIGLELDSKWHHKPLSFDLERVIDDFVFLCFFVGNDFLPHLPSLEIREGAIDHLMELYKKLVPRIGYLSDEQGEIHCGRVRLFLKELANTEEYIFKKRKEEEEQRKKQEERNRQQDNVHREATASHDFSTETSEMEPPAKKRRSENADSVTFVANNNAKNFEAAKRIKREIQEKETKDVRVDEGEESVDEKQCANGAALEEDEDDEKLVQIDDILSVNDEEMKMQFESDLKDRLYRKKVVESHEDTIRLGEEGWKDRYYWNKFHWNPQDSETARRREELANKYFEGLIWVMRYYYRGCISWSWYYPYHYAPFASDLMSCPFESKSAMFERGKPFSPLEQLMAVLPPSSAKGVLPDSLTRFMTDPNSALKQYYPENFVIDLEGKKFVWQGVSLLPFIDGALLENCVHSVQDKFTAEEQQRNGFGDTVLAVNRQTSLGQFISTMKLPNVSQRSQMAASSERIPEGYPLMGRLTRLNVPHTMVLEAYYYLPPMRKEHIPRVLEGAVYPPRALSRQEKYAITDGQTGWKAAWFGPLGSLAKKMIVERQQREDEWNRRKPQHGSSFIENSNKHHGTIDSQHFLLQQPPSGSLPSYVESVGNNAIPMHPNVQQAQMEFLQASMMKKANSHSSSYHHHHHSGKSNKR